LEKKPKVKKPKVKTVTQLKSKLAKVSEPTKVNQAKTGQKVRSIPVLARKPVTCASAPYAL